MFYRGYFASFLLICFSGSWRQVRVIASASDAHACHVHEKHQLKLASNYVVQTNQQPDQKECVAACMKSDNCRSVSFCPGAGTCSFSNFTSILAAAPADLLTGDNQCEFLELSNCHTPGHNPCSDLVCQNGGTCVLVEPEVPRPTAYCACPSRYVGNLCQTLYCPTGFDETYGTSCYMFDTSLQKSYSDAVSYCLSFGAHLVAVSDENEHNFLHNQISSNNARSGHSWRVDANDELNEGTWVMSSWGDAPVPYTAWDNGQPDNGGGTQDCAIIWNSGASWDDAGCDTTYHFICEYVGN